MITIKIIYSRHALEKMDSLGLERREIESVIKEGMKWQENEKWLANMYGVEVVFQREEDMIIVITVYYERRKK